MRGTVKLRLPREHVWTGLLLAWVAAFSDFPLCALAILIVVDVVRPFESRAD